MKELAKLGAQVVLEEAANPKRLPCLAWLTGVENLQGSVVEAHDLRGGVALLLAGLAAEGETIIHQAEKLWRGYAHFPEKFAALGASFELTEPSGEQVKGYAVAEFGH